MEENSKEHTEKNSRRTRKAVEEDVVEVKDTLATITDERMQYALTLLDNDSAKILPYDDHKLKFIDMDGAEFSTTNAKFLDSKNVKENVQRGEIDIMLIRTIFSSIKDMIEDKYKNIDLETVPYKEFSKTIEETTYAIYVPDLLRKMGAPGDFGYSKQQCEAVIEKLTKLNSVYGMIHETRPDGREGDCFYALLSTLSFSAEYNVAVMISPYLNHIVFEILQDKRKDIRDRSQRKHIDALYEKVQNPQYCYPLATSIAKCKSYRAIEIVDYIARLIYQTGNHKDKYPHASAQTVINNCPELDYALENAKTSKAKDQILRRSFTTARELLTTQTYLEEIYENLEFRMPIPKTGHLKSTVFKFPHGKRRNLDREEIKELHEKKMEKLRNASKSKKLDAGAATP